LNFFIFGKFKKKEVENQKFFSFKKSKIEEEFFLYFSSGTLFKHKAKYSKGQVMRQNCSGQRFLFLFQKYSLFCNLEIPFFCSKVFLVKKAFQFQKNY
jgi:hypothetical protein